MPCASSASMRAIGLPESPNPPTASDAPSGMSATASAADATGLVDHVVPTPLSDAADHDPVRVRRRMPIHSAPAGSALKGRLAMWMPWDVVSTLWNDATSVPGAQAIARAARLLRLVTAAGEPGSPVAGPRAPGRALAARPRIGCSPRCASRASSIRTSKTGRWMPGPELFLMGSVAASRYDVTGLARDIVRSLAVKTEESAFLSVRRGDETVCLLREEGSFPIRSFVLTRGRAVPARRGIRGTRDPGIPSTGTMSRPTSSVIPSCRSASGAAHAASPPARAHRATPRRADTRSTPG